MTPVSKLFIKSMSTGLISLVLISFLSLTACGGSSGGGTTPPPTTTINGKALAPGGQIALFEQQSIMVAMANFLISSAKATITGLEPVTNGTVELIRVDNNGVQVGSALASAPLSITGDYSLALPEGVSFAGDLVVRITGSGGNTMSAMVVEESIDITPASEFILQKFIADGTALDTLATNEVVALSGRVEEFDLTVSPGADLSAMLAQLEAEVGQLVDNEIDVINSTPGDTTTVAAVVGTWNLASFSLSLHDSDPVTTGHFFGTFAMDSGFETITVADAGNSDVTITDGPFDEAFTNFHVDQLGNASIYFEADTGAGDGETFPASIDSNGNLIVSSPFEEDLETVDLLTDPDGPDFGWRTPPTTFIITDTGNGNVKLIADREVSVRYETTDTNNDGVKDAVDPSARAGDEVFVDLTFALKQGSGMSNASLNGDYGLVNLDAEVSTAPVMVDVNSEVGVISFNGTDTLSAVANALNELSVIRTPATPPAVTLTTTNSLDPDPFTAPYSVTPEGKVTIDFGIDEGIEQWIASDDGNLIVSIDPANDDDGGTPPTIINSSHVISVATKLGTATPDLSDATYRLLPVIVDVVNDGTTALATYASDSALTFNAGATSASVSMTEVGFERSSDVAEVESLNVVEASRDFAVTTAANGAITISFNDGTDSMTMDGFVSADAKMMVLRTHRQLTGNPGLEQALGIMLAIKQ